MSSLAVVGAGWAGIACAVEAVRRGARVTLFEAARQAGGRARGLPGHPLRIDNGQHILIGAYTDTLALMRDVGADPAGLLLRQPLSLRFADGGGLALPRGPAVPALLSGVARARGWTWRDRIALLVTAAGWRLGGFRCDAGLSVAALCAKLPPRLREELIDPLCVSALNTPPEHASAQVFLRVLQDALFAGPGGSDLLLPRVDLDALLPTPALRWLHAHGCTLRPGHRVQVLTGAAEGWQVDGEAFDRVVLACPPGEAARLARGTPGAERWCAHAQALRFEPIATVYAQARTGLPGAMLALCSDSTSRPAQFVFDRGRLGGPAGLLAFVASAWHGPREALEAGVRAQARTQLGLQVEPTDTIVEKRATFACSPGLERPGAAIARGLHAAGDYVDGPYPATLEGAVRSGLAAARRALG